MIQMIHDLEPSFKSEQTPTTAMNSSLKLDQEKADAKENEGRISYRLCYKDRRKLLLTRPTSEDNIINTNLHEAERPGTRKVLRLARVNSVEEVQTKVIHEHCGNIKPRSVTSMDRRANRGIYLPYLLGNNDNLVTPVFNMASYKGFRTQQERKCLALIRTLDHNELLHGKKKHWTPTSAVIDITKPAQLHARYTIAHPKSAT